MHDQRQSSRHSAWTAISIGLALTLASATLGAATRPHATATAAGNAAVAGLAQSVPVVQHLGAPQTSPLVRTAYVLVRDSSGWHASTGAQICLLFGASGQAFVYAADAKEAVADPGSYSYAGGRLSLHFTTSDFTVTAAFDLSLDQTSVKMPFQVGSAKPGYSLWTRESLAIDRGVYAIFHAAGNSSAGNPTLEQAATAAYDYAQAWVAAGSSSPSAFAPSPAQLARAPMARTAASTAPGSPSPCSADGANCIASVENLGDDIKVTYKSGHSMDLSLYAWSDSAPGTDLQMSPLAGDPRVHLDPTVHPDGRFDPTNKTAVLIAPFSYSVVPWPSHTSIVSTGDIDSMARTLRGRGYKVEELLGAASIRVLQLTENMQREDLNPVDEARALRELMDLENLDTRKVGDRLHRSHAYVADRLKLIAHEDVAEAVQDSILTVSAATAVAREVDPAVRRILLRVRRMAVRTAQCATTSPGKTHHRTGRLVPVKACWAGGTPWRSGRARM